MLGRAAFGLTTDLAAVQHGVAKRSRSDARSDSVAAVDLPSTPAASQAHRAPSTSWAVPQLFGSGRYWGMVELIEAGAQSGTPEKVTDAHRILVEMANVTGTNWAIGVAARSSALLREGEAAESSYREAIDRLNATRLRPEIGRAHLLYGEWLRREHRRVDGRAQLCRAHDLFTSIAMEAFAERARKELAATGEKARKRTVETRDDLTA